MDYKELKATIRADLGYTNARPFKTFVTRYLFEAGFKFVFWLRITRYFYEKNKIIFIISRLILKHYSYKYSFDISYKADIGKGLQIAHIGYIIVTSNTVIGENCRLRPGVVFGKVLSRESTGAVVGNNVEFGVGSKIIGDVHIGNNVIIGANAVVVKDIPNNAVVAGIPGRVIRIRE
ncbi:MAG: hypothetical protein J6E46_10315 [Faecalicoccus sp.]|nr:hypothetical protein [Faecalicoccus sp.]